MIKLFNRKVNQLNPLERSPPHSLHRGSETSSGLRQFLRPWLSQWSSSLKCHFLGGWVRVWESKEILLLRFEVTHKSQSDYEDSKEPEYWDEQTWDTGRLKRESERTQREMVELSETLCPVFWGLLSLDQSHSPEEDALLPFVSLVIFFSSKFPALS